MRSAIGMTGTGLVCLSTASAQSVPAGVAGNPAAGKALFDGNGGCLTCHSIENRERKRGPDLSFIGMVRTPDALRHSLIDADKHSHVPSFASRFSAVEIDHLIAYLRTLRSIPPSEPRERTRSIAPTSENVEFFNRTGRDAEEQSDALVKVAGDSRRSKGR